MEFEDNNGPSVNLNTRGSDPPAGQVARSQEPHLRRSEVQKGAVLRTRTITNNKKITKTGPSSFQDSGRGPKLLLQYYNFLILV